MNQKSLVLDDYKQLVVLHKSLMHLKFSKSLPTDAVLLVSPILANIIAELVDILESFESEESNSGDYPKWRFEIHKNSTKWSICIRNVQLVYNDNWNSLSHDTKKQIAENILSPHIINEELIIDFIKDVDKAIS